MREGGAINEFLEGFLPIRLIQRIKDYSKKWLSWYFIGVFTINSFLTLEDKCLFSARPCNILYLSCANKLSEVLRRDFRLYRWELIFLDFGKVSSRNILVELCEPIKEEISSAK